MAKLGIDEAIFKRLAVCTMLEHRGSSEKPLVVATGLDLETLTLSVWRPDSTPRPGPRTFHGARAVIRELVALVATRNRLHADRAVALMLMMVSYPHSDVTLSQWPGFGLPDLGDEVHMTGPERLAVLTRRIAEMSSD